MGLDDMTLFFTGRDAEAPAGAGRVGRDIGQRRPSAKWSRPQGAIWNWMLTVWSSPTFDAPSCD
jgi:hypothetical protein